MKQNKKYKILIKIILALVITIIFICLMGMITPKINNYNYQKVIKNENSTMVLERVNYKNDMLTMKFIRPNSTKEGTTNPIYYKAYLVDEYDILKKEEANLVNEGYVLYNIDNNIINKNEIKNKYLKLYLFFNEEKLDIKNNNDANEIILVDLNNIIESKELDNNLITVDSNGFIFNEEQILLNKDIIFHNYLNPNLLDSIKTLNNLTDLNINKYVKDNPNSNIKSIIKYLKEYQLSMSKLIKKWELKGLTKQEINELLIDFKSGINLVDINKYQETIKYGDELATNKASVIITELENQNKDKPAYQEYIQQKNQIDQIQQIEILKKM